MPKEGRSRKRRTDRVLDARPDPIDFRDRMYVATLVEVPMRRPLAAYRELRVPILDQGQEGACTGFGLATVANYLLRSRQVYPDTRPVSARMFYEMAKRYDEWPGTSYSGSSARGAMKGWHKHGVCADALWTYAPKAKDEPLTHERAANASTRPLGAYFRVNHRDIVGMHAAITEAGILYATARVHSGWCAVDLRTGVIPLERETLGGHAFAVVAYDEQGLWIQNSGARVGDSAASPASATTTGSRTPPTSGWPAWACPSSSSDPRARPSPARSWPAAPRSWARPTCGRIS